MAHHTCKSMGGVLCVVRRYSGTANDQISLKLFKLSQKQQIWYTCSCRCLK